MRTVLEPSAKNTFIRPKSKINLEEWIFQLNISNENPPLISVLGYSFWPHNVRWEIEKLCPI